MDITGTVLSGASPLVFEGASADAYETTLAVENPAADRTVSLPNATDTLIGKATTDTLTNKTIDLGDNTVTGSLAEFNTALQGDSFVSLTGSETLTIKHLQHLKTLVTYTWGRASAQRSACQHGRTSILKITKKH